MYRAKVHSSKYKCTSVPIFLSPSFISFHQTIFLITQQKLQKPHIKRHQTTIREPNITLQERKGHFENKREHKHIKANIPLSLQSSMLNDAASSHMTYAFWCEMVSTPHMKADRW